MLKLVLVVEVNHTNLDSRTMLEVMTPSFHCVSYSVILLSDSNIQNQDVIDDSDVVDTIQSIALDIKVVCAFKESYDDSFEGKRSHNLQQLRHLASGKKSHAMLYSNSNQQQRGTTV